MSNQASILENVNFADDPALLGRLTSYDAGDARPLLRLGEAMGAEQALQWATDANRYPPELVTHDRTGRRIDRVDFHPAWHNLMEVTIGAAVHTGPWGSPGSSHVQRAAQFFLTTQTEAGHGCPISMTYAVVPALRHQPELADRWMPGLLSTTYDRSFQPAGAKQGVLFGMAMTERQGGSDVRSNLTNAVPVETPGPGRRYEVTGHKWFCSAPMNDAFLVLAQAPGGLSCFLLPRWREDGTQNALLIDRLKPKLGNRSNASSEVRFEQAEARLIGEEGRGLAVILEMVNHTRLDCVTGSAALMRQSVIQAVHNARHRSTFGRPLVDHALMGNVLADLALETEAAMELMFRLAELFDDPGAAALRRIGTPVAKYWVCKRTPAVVGEALECLGGNGYVEESPLPRIYRESPLNSVWEGSGNIICLDVLRAMHRSPGAAEAMAAELERGRGRDSRLDDAIEDSQRILASPPASEAGARSIVQDLAVTWQAVLLTQADNPAVAAAFLDGRLPKPRAVFGTLPSSHLDLVARVPAYS